MSPTPSPRAKAAAAGAAAVSAALMLPLAASTPAGAVQLAQSTVVAPKPVGWTPNVIDGKVEAIAEVGSKVVVGGLFTKVANAKGDTTEVDRVNLFAYDINTGALDTAFVPTLDGEVTSLAASADGTAVFVGGAFSNVNGVANRGLTKLDITNGTAVAKFKVPTDMRVNDLVLRGSKLYLGGQFTKVKNTPRTLLAAVDATTGALDANFAPSFTKAFKTNGPLHVARIDVTPDGSKLVASGNFSVVDGQTRNQLAIFDLTTAPASVSAWQTNRYDPLCSSSFSTYIRDLDISPDGSYFVVASTGAYNAGTLCDAAVRWEIGPTGPAQQPTWVNYTGGDTLWAIATSGAAVYIGGHQRWVNNTFAGDKPGPGAVPREGIGALDPQTGMPLAWNPGRDRGVGVFALVATSRGLYVGSDTDKIARYIYHGKLAMFPLAGGSPRVTASTVALPAEVTAVAADGSTSKATLSSSDTGVSASDLAAGAPADSTLTGVRAAFQVNGKAYFGMADGTLVERDITASGFGSPRTINLYGLGSAQFPIAQLTGMFYDQGKLFYTVAGSSKLSWRWFQIETETVGASTFVASGDGDGMSWSGITGMTFAGSTIVYATSDGTLHAVPFANGAPVVGAPQAVSTADGSAPWNALALVAAPGAQATP